MMFIIYIEHQKGRDTKEGEAKKFSVTIGSEIIHVLAINCEDKSSPNIKCERLI
jgi:hypothetical protein